MTKRLSKDARKALCKLYPHYEVIDKDLSTKLTEAQKRVDSYLKVANPPLIYEPIDAAVWNK